MKNTNIFKFLSISLLMCPLFSSAMEPINRQEPMLLSIANQSEQTVDAFFPILQIGQFNDFAGTIPPFEDQDSVVLKNGNAIISTQLGTFTLSPDNTDHPMYLVLSQDIVGHENHNVIIQEVPYHRSNNVVVMINPNGSVSLTQFDAALAEEKMNVIQQHMYLLEPEMLAVDDSSDSNSDEESYIALNPQEMLHQAILDDNAEWIRQAVQAGANINQSKDGKSAILWATLLKKSKVVGALLQCGAQANTDLVQYAIKLYDIKSAVLLAMSINSIDSGYISAKIENYIESSQPHTTLLTNAILQGDFESAVYLVKNGAALGQLNISHGLGNQLMAFILKRLNISEAEDLLILELLQEMINRGYKVDSIWELKKSQSFDEDISAKIYEARLLRFLLANGANPNYIIDMNKLGRIGGGNETWTPLLKAIQYNNVEAVEILLDAGADINMQGTNPGCSFTPISFAIDLGRIEIVALLLNRGAII